MTKSSILTINGGSSSIKFALYQGGEPLKRGLYGKVDRIGLSGTNLTFSAPAKDQQESRKLAASDHKSAASLLIDWLEEQNSFESVRAVGHRVVHGMQHTAPELVTQELLEELHRISPYDPDHLPSEIELIETFQQRNPKLPQVACFDTAFHRTMPRVAKLLPIPRCYDGKGVQRYGSRFRLDIRVPRKQRSDSFKGEREHALDNFCNSAGLVVFRAGHILHVWRVCSHPARPRSNRAGHPADSGTQGCLTGSGLDSRSARSRHFIGELMVIGERRK